MQARPGPNRLAGDARLDGLPVIRLNKRSNDSSFFLLFLGGIV
jgi:hypothetical protein